MLKTNHLCAQLIRFGYYISSTWSRINKSVFVLFDVKRFAFAFLYFKWHSQIKWNTIAYCLTIYFYFFLFSFLYFRFKRWNILFLVSFSCNLSLLTWMKFLFFLLCSVVASLMMFSHRFLFVSFMGISFIEFHVLDINSLCTVRAPNVSIRTWWVKFHFLILLYVQES